MSWYVLQVLTGQERDVLHALERQGIASLVPLENRMIRTGGVWVQREYVLFQGYVFIAADWTDELYHKVKCIAGVVRVLGAPTPLTDEEAAWVAWLGSTLLEPSNIEYVGNDRYIINDGALLALEDRIIRIDRHHRRAIVGLTVGGKKVKLSLSIRVHDRTLQTQ